MATINENSSIPELVKYINDQAFITQANADQIWILICGFLVFWMHAGFSMLETGSVRHKNAVNILFKNLATVAIGGIMYYLIGYAFAYGTDNVDNQSYQFIGSGNYALSQETLGDNSNLHTWFFQFAFAATGATIVSGAVAGRITLHAYFLTAVLMTGFTYPVVSHWIWATDAWASAFRDGTPALWSSSGGCGMIDYAGSGVVHMTGGVAAFWGALILGPRMGRFEGGDNMKPHNITMQTLGVFILWFGWFGFNCGSTLAFDGSNASFVAVTTTLAPSAAILTSLIYGKFISPQHFDIGLSLNSALAGLVSITAGCSTVPEWASIIIGIIGMFVYAGASKLMKIMKIDDPVDAVAVHGACGAWGCLAVGIFSRPVLIANAYSGIVCEGNGSGIQFASQLVGVLAIIAWVTLIMAPFFFLLKKVSILRVSEEMEEQGLDLSEHGGQRAFVADDDVELSIKHKGKIANNESVHTTTSGNGNAAEAAVVIE